MLTPRIRSSKRTIAMILPAEHSAWIASLGYEVLADGVEPHQRGTSGAVVCRVAHAGQHAILKSVPASAPLTVQQRAQRELQFYRALAPRVPLRVPELLASREDAAGRALLLQTYQPARAARDWSRAELHQVARQIAGLHAAYAGRALAPAVRRWLPLHQGLPSPEAVQRGRAGWQALRAVVHLAPLFDRETMRMLDRALTACAQPLGEQFLPATLCHGDCHTGNVLFDRQGDLVWADWQEVRLGSGADDLAFLWQRALADGADLELHELAEVYHAALVAALRDRPSFEALMSALLVSELRTRTLEWPFYLRDAPAEQVAAQLSRIATLVERQGA
jgi:Ser/Thr protein kinase RdoA (MazF antagonist)